MQNIKNFKATLPYAVDAKKTGAAVNTIQFLTSEDGQDWYECQTLFADDTIKIMYDENAVIRSLVDKPVLARGNTYAVSMFFPLNMSVAEIAADDFPNGVSVDGSWMFDGENAIPRVYTATGLTAFADKERERLRREASTAMAPLQDAADLNIATDEELATLKSWKMYRIQLSRVDLQAKSIEWPVRPEY